MTKEEFEITLEINNIRLDLTKCGFDFIIYNSPVNCEYLFAPKDL